MMTTRFMQHLVCLFVCACASAQAFAQLGTDPFTTIATIPGYWRLDSVDAQGYVMSQPDEANALTRYQRVLRSGGVEALSTKPIEPVAQAAFLNKSAFCIGECPPGTGTEWKLDRWDPVTQTFVALNRVPITPSNAKADEVGRTSDSFWVQYSAREDQPLNYQLVRYDATTAQEKSRISFNRHVLAVQIKSDRIGVVSMAPDATGKSVPHFEAYDLAGTMTRRVAIDRQIAPDVSTPVGSTYFVNTVDQSVDEWIVSRAFLKWHDLLRISGDGNKIESAPVSSRLSTTQYTCGALTKFTQENRVISVCQLPADFFLGFRAWVMVDGALVNEFTDDPRTRGVVFVDDTNRGTLYISRKKCCGDSLQTEIAMVRLDDLLARIARPSGKEEVQAPSASTANASSMIEYYHAGLDHFFYTLDPAEQQFIERGGAGAGWYRIGFAFHAWVAGTQPANAVPVCRFYGTPGKGPNSHFFTASRDECAAVKKDPGWLLESEAAFYVLSTDLLNTPDAFEAVARTYNRGFATNNSNHRFLTSGTLSTGHNRIYGWADEGIVFLAK